MAKNIIIPRTTGIDPFMELELKNIFPNPSEELTDFSKAKYIGKLWASGKYSQKKDLAKEICKSQSYISKALSCLKLNDKIIANIEKMKQDIPLSVLDEIARIKDPLVQQDVYKKYITKEITRDDIRDAVSMKEREKVSIEEKQINLSISICKGSKINLKVSM